MGAKNVGTILAREIDGVSKVWSGVSFPTGSKNSKLPLDFAVTYRNYWKGG